MLLGVHTDDVLGPVLTVGMGGVFTEALKDVSLRPVPISKLDARLMLGELTGSRVLEGFRGAAPSDTEALIAAMLALSAFADDFRDRRPEIELNPVVVLEHGALAVDIVLQFDDARTDRELRGSRARCL